MHSHPGEQNDRCTSKEMKKIEQSGIQIDIDRA